MSMNRTGNLVAVAAVLCALLLADTLRGGTGAEEDVRARTAFIDVNKVLSAHKGLRAVEEKIAQLQKAGQEELNGLKDEIDNLKNEISLFKPDSKEYWQGKCDLDRKQLAAKQREQEIILERDRMFTEALRQAYKDIEAAVRKYAKEKQLEAVFAGNVALDQLDTRRPEELLRWLSTVDVVWHDDRLDISDAVINIMNGT